ncbi:MAG: hypothetical protein L0Y42_07800 [Phycisphaerales bacterium]|nr:hypothetical protein [Phycisphaerales bacterium]
MFSAIGGILIFGCIISFWAWRAWSDRQGRDHVDTAIRVIAVLKSGDTLPLWRRGGGQAPAPELEIRQTLKRYDPEDRRKIGDLVNAFFAYETALRNDIIAFVDEHANDEEVFVLTGRTKDRFEALPKKIRSPMLDDETHGQYAMKWMRRHGLVPVLRDDWKQTLGFLYSAERSGQDELFHDLFGYHLSDGDK